MASSVGKGEVTRFLSAWFAARQLIQAANFNHFQGAGLSATQFMTLNLLPENEDSITMGDLARRMNLKPATVAKTVDSLEARSMLARTKSPTDGRVVLLRITNQGRQLQNAAAGQFRDHIGGLFRAMPPQERSGLILGLESLVRMGASGGTTNRAGVNREAVAVAPVKRSSRRSPRK